MPKGRLVTRLLLAILPRLILPALALILLVRAVPAPPSSGVIAAAQLDGETNTLTLTLYEIDSRRRYQRPLPNRLSAGFAGDDWFTAGCQITTLHARGPNRVVPEVIDLRRFTTTHFDPVPRGESFSARRADRRIWLNAGATTYLLDVPGGTISAQDRVSEAEGFPLTSINLANREMDWTADGDTGLIATRLDMISFQLRRIDPQTAQVQPWYADLTAFNVWPRIAPAGDRAAIAYTTIDTVRLGLLGPGGSMTYPLERTLYVEDANSSAPSWSPDGRFLLARLNFDRTLVIDTASGQPAALTQNPVPSAGVVVWSPDGARFATQTYRGLSRPGLLNIVDPAGGQVITLSDPAYSDMRPFAWLDAETLAVRIEQVNATGVQRNTHIYRVTADDLDLLRVYPIAGNAMRYCPPA
jgi:WD40 repeat protein